MKRRMDGWADSPRVALVTAWLSVHPTIRLSAQCPDGSPPPCRVVTGPGRVPLDANALAVMPFRTSGASAEAAWLGEGMVDLLSVALDGFADWRTVHPRTVLARVSGPGPDLAAAAAAARAAGAGTMIVGSAIAVGPELRLHAEWYDAVRVTRLAAVDASGALERPGPVVDGIAVGLARERLRRHPVAGARAPQEYATTSPQALRVYVAAEREARRGEFRAAAESLQHPIALDSTFGLAYFRVYALSSFTGAPPGGGRFDLVRLIRAALQHAARLPQRQRDLLATVDLQQRGLVTEALRRADELSRRYPDDAEAAYVEGESYYHLGIFAGEPRERGLAAFERGVQLDPGLLENYNHAIELRSVLGDTAGAWVLLRQIRKQAPAYMVARAIELALRVGLHDEDPARVVREFGALDTDGYPGGSRSNQGVRSGGASHRHHPGRRRPRRGATAAGLLVVRHRPHDVPRRSRGAARPDRRAAGRHGDRDPGIPQLHRVMERRRPRAATAGGGGTGRGGAAGKVTGIPSLVPPLPPGRGGQGERYYDPPVSRCRSRCCVNIRSRNPPARKAPPSDAAGLRRAA